MNSIKDFTNRELQLMDIHVLRNLARSIGVSSPTTKSKGELIVCILDIVTGKSLPEYKNVNRGRPAKQDVNKIVLYKAKSAFEDNIFSKDTYVASKSEKYVVDKFSNGVLHILPDGSGVIKKLKFVESALDPKVQKDQITKHNLKENDVISYTIHNGEVTIVLVNGKSVQSSSKTFGDKKLILGKKNILFVSSLSQKQNIISGLAGSSKVIYLPGTFAVEKLSSNVIKVNNNGATGSELINSFCASLDVALFYGSTGANVSLVADNFLNVITAIKQSDNPAETEAQVLSKIDMLSTSNITFVGLIASELKGVFNNLDIAFDFID